MGWRMELLRGCERRNLLWLKDVHLGATSDKDTMSHLSLLSSISQWNANVAKSHTLPTAMLTLRKFSCVSKILFCKLSQQMLTFLLLTSAIQQIQCGVQIYLLFLNSCLRSLNTHPTRLHVWFIRLSVSFTAHFQSSRPPISLLRSPAVFKGHRKQPTWSHTPLAAPH